MSNCTQRISNGWNKCVDFCGSTLDGIKGFGVDQIRSAVKTHNFALVILAAACVGLGLHLAATSIPAYLFMGVFTGAVIHLAKDEIYSQISEKWAMKRWTELALSTISLGVTVWYLPMTSVCTAVTILCSDPYMISNAIRNLQPPKK